eukprot:GFYU01005457.1.p2 GENE.GFYU01005457.1~~GFYU01005457.1.p2  ORF type:complete len:145 (-),score=34.92 GFYU01005457.1:1123-1557(-)
MDNGAVLFAAQNTVHLFFHQLDDNCPEEFADLFVEDGQGLELSTYGKTYKTKAELCEFVKFIKSKYPNAQHWEGNLVLGFMIENGVTFVNSVSYWKCIDGGEIVSQGKHEDLLRIMPDGQAKFISRKVTHDWTKAAGHRMSTKT